MKQRFLTALTLCLSLCLPAGGSADPLAKQLFGAAKTGSNQTPEPFGGYAKGCAAGLVELPETGPTWQAMRLNRNRNWALPDTVDFLQDLSRDAKKAGWPGLYIGDLSQPRGGPMLTGHRSHQNGLDADIWLTKPKRLNLTRAERESLSAVSMRRANGAYVNEKWTRAHHEIIKAAAKDPRVSRIFIFPGAKVQMCNDEKGSKRWLRKVRPWWGHHYHIHVRLKCPRGASTCEDQAPPPRGNGCADAEAWVRDIIDPPAPDPNAPKPQKAKELVMADLPAQCDAVLRSK